MLFPIVVDEHGDLMLFASETELSDYLEPIDVRNEEYLAYDSEGFRIPLLIEVDQVKVGLFGRKLEREKVVLSDQRGEAVESELKEKIIRYLRAISVEVPVDADLSELLELLGQVLDG